MQENVNKLVEWLQQQVRDAGLDGLLVGVSGGVDSAVVAHLIKKAFPENSLAVILPCKSNPGDQDAAQKVIDSCGIEAVTVDLTETHNVLFSTIKDQLQSKNEYNEDQERLADANLRARLRMSTLYTLGTNYKYLVVGTDNAAEWYTGYFTKYGDGGVDLVPLLHFTKGEVRELARELGVPSEIVEKAPSAGLWEGQTDEKELGVSYDTIDKHLKGEEIPEDDKKVIEDLHKKTEHKRDIASAPPKF
ncbi:NAD(+) synthase [Pontibacillus yanchengensis]|uniref:NH(3)-dependent NAD(+) synthetase n=1 Tax=Pontibacillus yanchengensis Y32 TaxID=1385514 RepID=A0A0A2TXC5_9BACI|nr:NAD(+) synthase [Pontibacillus yanchengensis]KGP73900.1 NAD synthetase [Pontibacillus yanchengensis Y32]